MVSWSSEAKLTLRVEVKDDRGHNVYDRAHVMNAF